METAMPKKAQLNRESIVEILEAWARYRHGRETGGTGLPKQVLLGKLLDGVPGIDCPRCKDAVTGASVGYVYVDAPGIALKKVICPVCNGARKAKLCASISKANPALIRGSGSRSFIDDDPVSQRVDWLICTALDQDQRTVLMAEFCSFGNRNKKISELHITHSMYNGLLDAAMDIIQDELNNC